MNPTVYITVPLCLTTAAVNLSDPWALRAQCSELHADSASLACPVRTKQVAAHRTRRDKRAGGGEGGARARALHAGRPKGVRPVRGGGAAPARARAWGRGAPRGDMVRCPAISVSSLVPNSTIGQYYIHK